MSDKIRVLQFPIGNTKGGVTHYAINNWRFIDKTQFHFDFATMSTYLSLEEEIRKSGADVYHITEYAEKNPEKFYDEFCNILRKGRYDIVHLHTSHWKSMVAEQAVKDTGIFSSIIHAHNTDVKATVTNRQFEMNRHLKLRQELIEDGNTSYWACSHLASDFLFGNRISKDKIKIMKNAIELASFQFNSQMRLELREKLGLNENNWVIGCVGRFVYQKNQEFLLQVMKDLRKKNRNVKLILVGDGENIERCKSYVKENLLDDIVTFLGYRNDINNLMMAFDVLAMTSRFEGLPITLIEAQASGLMCYASEAITKEARITENVEFLPLHTEIWVEKLSQRQKIKRENMSDKVAEAGYDIRRQIKIIESSYRRDRSCAYDKSCL